PPGPAGHPLPASLGEGPREPSPARGRGCREAAGEGCGEHETRMSLGIAALSSAHLEVLHTMDPLSPQQPAWISSSTAETELRTRTFIRSVYGWMFGGLLLTAFAALWVVMSPAMQQIVIANRVVALVLILAELGIVVFLSFRLMAMSPGTAAAAFLVYSFLNGLTLRATFFPSS